MKMRQSNSSPICTPTGRQQQQTIVVYCLAINDSQGLSSRAFPEEEPVLLWLADNAEGADDSERLELRRLAQQADKLLFWRFLRQVTPPYVQYRLQCHTLTLKGGQ
jgi:hypothetical protein